MSEWTVWVTGHGSFTVNADDAADAERDSAAIAKWGAGFALIEWHEVEVAEVSPAEPVILETAAGTEAT